MIRLPYLLILLICSNLLIAGLLHGWVYDALDQYVYEQKSLLYKDALKDSRETLSNAPSNQWNALSDELGVKYGTNSMVYTRDSKELPTKVLDYISDTIASDGIVDPFTPDIYYPIGPNHVFILGPLVLSSWHMYIIEWTTLLASVLSSSLIIVFYYLFFQTHLGRITKNLSELGLGVNTSTIKNNGSLRRIYTLLKRIKVEQRELEKSNKTHIQSQRDLLHGVAHEFRSPMARMQFALEMIAEGNLDEQAKMVDKLNNGIEELDELVKELLSYSRIKHLNHQLKLDSVAVSQIIQESIDKVSVFYPHVTFAYNNDDDKKVLVDDRLIQRALANILRNAGRFSKTLCQVTVKHSDELLIINIDDDGDGIPPGKRERIFEPFTRLDPSRSRDSGGTGLGLAIVQSIAEQHNGIVGVDDSELGGACFSLHLPLKQLIEP
jgi:two-component system sensor histidine kinase RstB